MKYDFEPLEDRVVVRPDRPETILPSGLILPDVAQENAQMGVVLAAGPDAPLKPDDYVFYSQYGSAVLEINDEKLLSMRSRDVIARLTAVKHA